MTKQDYNKAIILVVHYIVKNNAFGVAKALKDEKYNSKNYIPQGDLETALLQLYIANPDKFFKVLKNISWNTGHGATNQPIVKNNLIKLSSLHIAPAAKGDWWQKLISFLSSHTPVTK